MRPFFTIIIPTHCRAELLERSIDSLRAQTFPDLEIILVSDCTDQETSRVAVSKLTDLDVLSSAKARLGPPRVATAALNRFRRLCDFFR